MTARVAACSIAALLLFGCAGRAPPAASVVAAPRTPPVAACTLFARAPCEAQCRSGEAQTCLLLGRIDRDAVSDAHARGRGIPWFSAACDGGAAEGCEQAGLVTLAASGGLPSDNGDVGPARAALAFFARACDGGMAESCAQIGDIAWSAHVALRDPPRARDAYTRACLLGRIAICQHVAELLAQGELPGSRVLDDAARLFRRACDAEQYVDREAACAREADMYLRGAAADDPQRAADSLEARCHGGHAPACIYVSLYFARDGDAARRIAALEHACELGEAFGCEHAATLTLTADPARAVELEEKGCALGASRACLRAASAYESGAGVAVDRARAGALRKVACETSGIGCPGRRRSKMDRDR